MNRTFLSFVLSVWAMTCGLGGDENNAAKALDQLKSLAGDWEGSAEWTGARAGNYPMNASYYVTGNGSALVENLITEGSPVMTSVYHLDGAALRMTHFCGAQNQPRLKADQIDLSRGLINFAFVDITNLRSRDAPHVHGMEMRLIDSNHISITFLFQGDKKESHERIDLRRSAKKMIKLRNLERSYPLEKEKFFYVLRDINPEVGEGDFVFVMGSSGAGKSTLLHIQGMHDHGWRGEYLLAETAVHHLNPKDRAARRSSNRAGP